MNTYLNNVYGTTDETVFKMWFGKIQMMVVEQLPFLGLFFRKGTVMTTANVSGLSAVLETDAFRGLDFVTKIE